MTALLLTLAIYADFPICSATNHQYYPVVCYANNMYYVFWEDRRYTITDADYAVFGSRVSTDGAVIDPDGKLITLSQVHYDVNAAFDGVNFLVAYEDSC